MAGGPTQPAPPSRAPHRLSASCGAPPRKRASGGPAGETGLDTRQPAGLADETRAPPSPPSAHGARPRRRSHIREPAPESRPHRHGGRQWPEPVALAWPDVGLRGARRRPHGGHRIGSGWTRITPDRSPPRWRGRQPRWPRPPGIAAAHAPAPTRDRPGRSHPNILKQHRVRNGSARERLPTPSKPLRPFVNERIHESSAEPPDVLQGSIRRR